MGSILYLAIVILVLVGLWKIFTKAGKPGWAILIPIYNLYVLLQIVNKPWWWLILFIVPVVNFVFIIWTFNRLSKSFGQGVGFTIGLLILSFIFIPVLGFGSYSYKKLPA